MNCHLFFGGDANQLSFSSMRGWGLNNRSNSTEIFHVTTKSTNLNMNETKVTKAQNLRMDTSTSLCSGLNRENHDPMCMNIHTKSKSQERRIAAETIRISTHFTSSAKYLTLRSMSTMVRLMKSVFTKQTSIVRTM